MALPKIQYPIFEFTMPSNKLPIKFRPFTVKEEKILLIAQESSSANDKLTAMRQIVNNCCLNLDKDIGEMPSFDLEYAFLKIRSKSVGNMVELKYKNNSDNKIYAFEVDLDDVEVTFTEGHSNIINLEGGIGLTMKYPTIEVVTEKLPEASDNSANSLLQIVKECIDSVFDADNVYKATEYTAEELDEFIEGITSKGFENIIEFFNTIPVLKHELKYTDSTGTDQVITLLGIDDFFQ